MGSLSHARNRPEVLVSPEDRLVGDASREGGVALAVASVLLEQLLDHTPATVAHSLRVARLTALMATHLPYAMRPTWAQRPGEVYAAGLTHDVGKLRVPLAILEAPRPLTAAERAVVEEHPGDGVDLIRDAAPGPPAPCIPPVLVDAAWTHHEHWDGRGYPRRLRGRAIPLVGRLVGLADAYDAMREDRPYRPALSHHMAIYEIVRGAGAQFDPFLVAFVLDQRLLTD
jgi:putative two-component system response regulator